MENNLDELRFFFEPATVSPLTSPFMPETDTLGAHLQPAKEASFNVAIAGINTHGEADAVRPYLYALQGGFPQLKITDLGNFKADLSAEDLTTVLPIVAEILSSKNIFLILLGGEQQVVLPLVKGLNRERKDISISLIDALADNSEEANVLPSRSYLSALLTDSAVRFVQLLGYQTYLISQSQLHSLNQQNVLNPAYRLGAIRNNLISAEPVFRNSDILSFDLSAIRQSDAPSTFPMPNGLAGEEACQLLRFAGISDRLTLFSLCGFDEQRRANNPTEFLAAQMVWHLLEGLNMRTGDYPVCSLTKYKKYIVPSIDANDMVFYRSEQNNRWWIEVPMADAKRVLACSNDDYDKAVSRQMPDVWFRYFKR